MPGIVWQPSSRSILGEIIVHYHCYYMYVVEHPFVSLFVQYTVVVVHQ